MTKQQVNNLLPFLPDLEKFPKDKIVGITSTIPIEIVFAAGYVPIDLNNIFICDTSPNRMVEDAELVGLPRNTCAWIKGMYSAVKKHGIRKIISVIQGDCSNNQALMEVFVSEGIETIPFAYPHSKTDTSFLRDQMEKLAASLGVSYLKAEETKKHLDWVRSSIHEIDRLTWAENVVTGEENHLWTVSTSDVMGDFEAFGELAGKFLQSVSGREPIKHVIRLGVIGIPPICEDLYPFLSSLGVHVVFNEIQRQFSMPYQSDTLVEQYSRYTYPYDIFSRLEDIQEAIHQRRIHGIIHYVQSFCHRHIQDKIIRKIIRLPILTLDCDRPGPLDGAMMTRIEAFIEMIKSLKTEPLEVIK
ncbi:MAG: 2-hydroxyacyl-CoA dehydratase [Candidatus Kuenenia sp.]|nr:2-hydroxyacyl-CoA dehydratase [Candidatus Kuenenia hertensis]